MSALRSEKPVVSVIVEGYNESRDLGKAVNTIEALQRQDFPADQVEIILMGSATQVKEWRALYGQSTPFWGVQAVEAEGLSYLQLKNRGAEFASAEILAFTDSDVYPHRTWLSSLVEGIRGGGDVSIGLSLFKSATDWEWNRATRLAADSSRTATLVGTMPHARNLPCSTSCRFMCSGYRATVSPYWNASKFTMSTPASTSSDQSVLPQQCTPARAPSR